MPSFKTPLEIYHLLPKTNCGDCRISSCLAFAAALLKQEGRVRDCPHLDKAVLSLLEDSIEQQVNLESIQLEQLKDLRKKISGIDLILRAERLGARTSGRSIIVPCLGREFTVDPDGAVRSECHTHAWFAVPLLSYILFSNGLPVSGRWVPLRELDSGAKWSPLFVRRCEKPLTYIADTHGELFGDLISMFSGMSGNSPFASDVSVVLFPFPKVPLLICYWRPDEGMESKLHVFFDDTAEKNLPIDSLFTLGTGIVRMLEKIMMKHTDVDAAIEP